MKTTPPRIGHRQPTSVGRVTPCATLGVHIAGHGAHGVTRPTLRLFVVICGIQFVLWRAKAAPR